MGVRDALLLNQTGSNFQALQTNDTARIQGDLSVQKDNATEVLGIDVSQGAINVSGDITGSLNISSSLSSTGSFGRVVANTFHGDGKELQGSLPRSSGLLTSSAQISDAISGSFIYGFEFGLSSSISGGMSITGSFGRLDAGTKFTGDGSGIKTSLPRSTGILTSSAQIASNISGSFNKGFEFTGTIQTTPGGVFQASDNLPTSATGGTAGSMVAGDAIQASGIVSPYPYKGDQTQLYNGTSWSEVNDQNSARDSNGTTLVGNSDAALLFGGCADGSSEEWNGTNWSEVNDGDTSMRDGQGTGESSEAAIFTWYAGGGNLEWNGTNWSEIADAGQQRYTAGMIGSRDSALFFGGYSGAQHKLTELWNGSSWSELNDMLEEFGQGFGFGSSNDGVAVGGSRPAITPWPGGSTPSGTSSQLWNGTSWSTGPNMNTGRHQRFGYGGSQMTPSGVSNEGFVAGGSAGGHPHIQAATEIFPGNVSSASFGRVEATTLSGNAGGIATLLPYPAGLITSSAQLATAISGSFNKGFNFSGTISGSATSTGSFGRIVADTFHGDAGEIQSTLPRATGLITSSAQLASSISGSFNKGFEFTGTIQTTPGGTWSAGGAMTRGTGLNINNIAGTGTKTAALGAGGGFTGAVTEEYDGTSWTEVNDLILGRHKAMMTGTTEASVAFGGAAGSTLGNATTCTEEWNGSSWTEVNDMINAVCSHMKLGITSEAALAVGGEQDGDDNCVQDWNGTNWSEETDLPANKAYGGSAGTYDSGIVFGWTGTETYCWNGSSWSDVADRAIARYQRPGGAGTSNDAFIAGGRSPALPSPQVADCVEMFDGTSWSSGPDMPAARETLGSADSLNTGTNNAMIFGGGSTTAIEFTGNISTGSFGRVEADYLTGDGSWLTNKLYPGLISSSAQIASYVSGSFTSGFSFSNQISGSATSTGSFGRVESDDFRGDGSELTNLATPSGLISASAQIATEISGSFNKGFEFTGTIQTTPGGVFASSTNLPAAVAGGTAGSMLAGDAIAAGSGTTTQIYNGSAWSEVNDQINSRHSQGATLVGDCSAALLFGTSPAGETEEWNGTNWSEVNDAGQQQLNGQGTGESSEAAIWTHYAANGNDIWNGSNWTEITDNGNMRYNAGFTGAAESALLFGGYSSGTHRLFTELWNGSSWSELNDMNEEFLQGFAFGSSNDAVGGGGTRPSWPGNTTTQLWNGTSWSAGPNMVAARYQRFGSAGSNMTPSGASTDGWAGGGSPGASPHTSAITEVYPANISTGSFGRIDAISFQGDGSNIASLLPHVSGLVTSSAQLAISGAFTSGFDIGPKAGFTASLSSDHDLISTGSARTARMGIEEAFFTGVSGSKNMNFGGGRISSSQAGSDYTHLLEFDKQGQIRGSVINGTWSTGGALSKASGYHTQFGTQDATIIAGRASGSSSPYNHACTEQYDGSTWSEVSNISTQRSSTHGVGTVYAGLMFGGYNQVDHTEEWNGQNWSEVSEAPYGTHNQGGFGTQNAASFVGGRSGDDCHQDYNGVNWAAGPNLIRDAWNVASAGLQYAGLIFGTGDGSWNGKCTDEYDGSSWSAGGALINNTHANAGAGTQNSAWSRHCSPNAQNTSATTEFYNGTSWSAGPLGLVDSYASKGSGTTTAGLLAGGNKHPYTPGNYHTCTEEFNATNFNTSASFGLGDGIYYGEVQDTFTSSLASEIITGSSQIASYVSGSFTSGIDLRGGHLHSAVGAGVWSFGPDMNAYGRYDTRLAGTQNAMAMVQGDVSSNPPSYAGGNPAQSTHEHYDGTAWKWMKPMLRCGGGNSSPTVGTWGSQNSFGAAGRNQGNVAGETEIWNGTSWSEVNDLITDRGKAATSGCTVDDALFSGGLGASNADQHCCTEMWNGTNWSDSQRTIRNLSNNHVAGGTSNSFFLPPGNANNAPQYSEIFNGSAWSTVAGVPDVGGKAGQGGDGNINNFVYYGAGSGYWGSSAGAFWDGTAWSDGPNKLQTTAEAGGRGFGGGMGGPAGMIAGGRSPAGSVGCNQTELFNETNMTTTGSFGIVKPVRSCISTDVFSISGDETSATKSTFKLPLFSDKDLHYHSIEEQSGTGSLSGSVDRNPDVDLLSKPGHFFFHTDYNALGYTYMSASVYSQSIDFVTCQYGSASYIQSQSTGFVTSSFYKYTNVICYVTGSYT